ncbi:MAG: hypothetical protein ACXQTI_00360 [Candidatus Nezhaarchaeales archaeon]
MKAIFQLILRAIPREERLANEGLLKYSSPERLLGWLVKKQPKSIKRLATIIERIRYIKSQVNDPALRALLDLTEHDLVALGDIIREDLRAEYDKGYDDGYSDGYDEGYDAGYEEAEEEYDWGEDCEE